MLLLGIGREGAGVQVSLLDVSDLAAPKRVSQLLLGNGWTRERRLHGVLTTGASAPKP
jgi:uncharacterized secreted protein with C-terminal beta-propeller domain